MNELKQENHTLISIITPTYNVEKTLDKTIRSVQKQLGSTYEHIIVDGGSSDGTIEILKKYGTTISWTSGKDKGIYDAMNKGLGLAQGDLIGILNADDVYLDGVLETVEKLADQFPDVDVFCANIKMIFENRPHRIFKSNSQLKITDFWRLPICHPTMFVRRRAYKKWGSFSDYYRIASDYEFVLRLFLKGARFHFIDSLWVEMSAGGVSDVNWENGKNEVRAIAKKFGIYGKRVAFRFYWDAMRIRTAYLIEKVPVINSLQFLYRRVRSNWKF